MTPLIGNLFAEAASSAIHGLGSGQGARLFRPPGWPMPVPRKCGVPLVLRLTLIKIEVSFGR